MPENTEIEDKSKPIRLHTEMDKKLNDLEKRMGILEDYFIRLLEKFNNLEARFKDGK